MDRMRGADVVAKTLERLGVTRIFSLSGNHIMPIFDALLATKIEIVHVRQEAACVHMADAWGRLTGEVGVALVTGGQGMSNGAAALFTALAAESPLLLLSGHAGLKELGRGAFQELAQADIARPMAKASWTASSVATLGTDLAAAMRIALEGRPGPVHLALPVDLLEESVDERSIRLPDAIAREAATPAPDLIDRVTQIVADHERPLIVVGPALGGDTQRAASNALAQRLGVPIVAMESPRGINDPALGSFAEVLKEADLLVLIGKPLDFTLKFGDAPAVSGDCKFVVIDPDPELVARAARSKGDRLLASGIGDPSAVLEALGSSEVPAGSRQGEWYRRATEALSYEPPEWDAAESPGRVHPVQLCRAVRDFLGKHPGGTLICDGGEIGQWPQAIIKGERRLVNGVSGTIGASIPFAIAARCLNPAGPVVAILGDGTFGFHMAELDTAVRYDLPIIVVIGNDARWNAEYQIQLRSFGIERAKNCELLPSRYEQVAEALGGIGMRVTSPEELPAALEAAHATGKPACINVMIEGVPAPAIRRSR
ncbi:thiamine pyrophosphate-binding protein [Methylobacterium brachythecii]|uniref:Acetolactate synthase-1/2/3 large subunit n=1 Tax=Methylobacterium brachythecii TaxID=1176177 RepID=A0A7W6F8V3_9HYPH|nr:thiamine pyrophosphate-binding protein [Methylobacterium brachythecii]MBB3904820.1 acetolactate synthase-1/2/3 large subunit [Methylobacterium brachythecii]GLS45372.1 thiamine pyrophosphate-requiring enzyme [Methylobacterium brachythecii]